MEQINGGCASLLLAAYKHFPLRPHCSPPRHTALCRMMLPHLPFACGERPSNLPEWKDWQR